DDFFFDSRVSGNDPKKRKMQPMYLLDVWKQGYTLEEIKSAWEEYSELKPKFKFDHTPTPDDQQRMARVRRTVYIHDDGTEEIIGST
ncbi:hypothetical protein NPN14_24735, partial [Vibrio parahaemolyticus]|uniref:hypothetical protein n=1 Tax=Vibrio parahaemolyticus TaxID=670 RepID=UPI0021136C83